jgi:predicted 3-demethylubiquinone-9 3-methyltransferase (glyoxalase superfamily)
MGGDKMDSQKIVPHLWFDREAEEAARFYTTVFPGSEMKEITTLHDTPSGDCDVVTFSLAGFDFMAINGGSYFKPNPSISFFVNFDPLTDEHAREHIDTMWMHLSAGGERLMPLQEYPFSERYGWIRDRYGVSWQLMLTDPTGEVRPFIIPSLMFTGEVAGKAEEATDFYQSVFRNSRRGSLARYGAGMEPDAKGTLMFTDFMLEHQWFAAMDSARSNGFGFNEAISLLIDCDNQEEIDYYWQHLSADPSSEQCGWIKDRYGVSWQVHPGVLGRMMSEGSRDQVDRLTKEVLTMKKLDIARLEQVFANA